jgi:uncharacterized protein (TIGR02145 family)
MKKNIFTTYKCLLFSLAIVIISSCEQDDTLEPNTLKDARDGTIYKTVKIGEQVWMAENLKYLPSVNKTSNESETLPYYYVYGYNGTNVTEAKATDNFKTYGVLYNWHAALVGNPDGSATNPSGIRGICPKGWHLPSREEWQQLSNFLGGNEFADEKMQEAGSGHWADGYNTGANNESGFTALPGGWFDSGSFSGVTIRGLWWSTSYQYDQYYVWQILNDYFQLGGTWTASGASCRCVKDN